MKLKVIILICCCLCLMSCSKKESDNIQQEILNTPEVTNTDFAKTDKADSRIVNSFTNSLCEEEYLKAYKDLVLFLWEKEIFIENNFDSIEKNIKKYKLNETYATQANFYNNELLLESPVKIGMTKDDVYNLFGCPEQSILENNTEVIKYFYCMNVPRYNESEGRFYAYTGIYFFFDENKIITKITLFIEDAGEEPVYYSEWEE